MLEEDHLEIVGALGFAIMAPASAVFLYLGINGARGGWPMEVVIFTYVVGTVFAGAAAWFLYAGIVRPWAQREFNRLFAASISGSEATSAREMLALARRNRLRDIHMRAMEILGYQGQ